MSAKVAQSLELASAAGSVQRTRGRRLVEWGGRPAVLPVLATVLALFIGAVPIAVANAQVRAAAGYFFARPGDFFQGVAASIGTAYGALFRGAIYDPSRASGIVGALTPIATTLFVATPLILTGLGISIAFRAGLFNIGGQGQIIAGAIACGYVGFAINLPSVLHLPVALIAGLAAGAAWGFIPGALKVFTGANEIITTSMLNYVALNVLNYLLTLPNFIAGPGAQGSRVIAESARLPHLLGPDLLVSWGFVLCIAVAVGVAVLFTRTTLGFKLRAIGSNPAASHTAGMRVGSITIIALSLSGSLAGLGGAVIVLGGSTSFQVVQGVDSGVGFTAIIVALLGRLRAGGVVASGLLLGALIAGGSFMQSATNVPSDIVIVIQALIVVFVAAPKLVKAIFRLKGSFRSLPTSLSTQVVTAAGSGRRRANGHIMGGAVYLAIATLLTALAFSERATQPGLITFSLPGDAINLGTWPAPTRAAILTMAALLAVAGAGRLTRKIPPVWCAAVGLFAIANSFVLWSVAGSLNGINVVSLLQGSLFPAAIPLVFASLAGVIGERSGVVNIALEGQLLLAAMTGAMASSLFSSSWAGLIGGVVGGVAIAALLGMLAIRFSVDQVIIGVTLNLLALGLTSFLYLGVMQGESQSLNTPTPFPVWSIPGLSEIPIIGPVLFRGTIFLYLAYFAVAISSYALFRTRWGLRVRSVGEHPRAADTVGINVRRTRWRAVLLAGALAGMGGAFLVVGSGAAITFQLNMSAGKGFIALAAVIFGRWRPIGALAAALLFGFADQLQALLSQSGAPIDSNLLLALPYIVTLIIVAGFIGRVRAPAADGQPYEKG